MSLWDQPLVASRLLEYELWTRIHARSLGGTHGEQVRSLLDRVAFVEMDRKVLARAVEPFPAPVRALDALHLASLEFVRGLGQDIALASYDEQMVRAARALGVRIFAL